MDPLDFSVYRFLSPEGAARFWAGRRRLDPRVTPREIAERVGISETAVRTRLQHLTERGFLRDKAVVPNPSLFGKRVFVADLLVKQSAEVDRILRDLTLLDGVVFTRDLMDEDERKIQVYFVSETEASAARFANLLGRISPEPAAVVARPYYIPECDGQLSPLDWRVFLSVWHHPDSTLAQIAEDVGVSVKTAGRSYHRLIDTRACWWTHGPESEEFPLALVRTDLRSPKAVDSVQGWIDREAPAWMPVASDGFGSDPGSVATTIVGLVPADLPTVLERFLRKLAARDGVVGVGRTFSLGSVIYTAWFADRALALTHRPV